MEDNNKSTRNYLDHGHLHTIDLIITDKNKAYKTNKGI